MLVELGTVSKETLGQKGILQERDPQTGAFNYKVATFG